MSIKTYSLKKHGSTKLSEHFTVREFACHDGSDTVLIDDRLVTLLEKIRDRFGKPIHINSVIAILPDGYRPLMNYQDVCFGLSGYQFLDIRTDGNIYFRCDAGEDIASTTVLRIHSVCVCG